ncbi:metallophosphoesterase [Hyphococcus flavus]|uniref:Metallophosphoesterase n=1 Tax=Hyphococcus flavus TaxID=1866326 RepID=A0AAE9ZG25_9PROT|nr:metallophosphoesterase [Hyphococcus flavus]WDI30186.1 metallophosphoesterase [Hyphococcus flavus]
MTDIGPLEWIKLAIFYVSYLYVVAAPTAFWFAIIKDGVWRWGAILFLIVITLLAYGRFVEPRILLTHEHNIALDTCFESSGAMRVAVFSDTHNGLFKNAMPIKRIVKAVEASKPDFTVIAGDFIYFLAPEWFEETFGPFADLSAPVFAVLGNHDIGLPGPDLTAPLQAALPVHGVRLIDNEALILSNSQFAIELVGLSDQWGRRQDLTLLEPDLNKPRIVLTHNPATVRDFSTTTKTDLLIGGHTHGGQIQLPMVTCVMTGVCGDNASGLRMEKGVLIFTTPGTGMVGLPMRFRMPPRIDMLNISYSRCPSYERDNFND